MTNVSQIRPLGMAAAFLMALFSHSAWGADVYETGSFDSSLSRIDQLEAQLSAVRQQLDTMDVGSGGMGKAFLSVTQVVTRIDLKLFGVRH